MKLHSRECKYIYVAIMRTDGQVPGFFDHLSFFIFDVRRELDVLKPCLHWTLFSDNQGPGTRLKHSESTTAIADSTKTAVRRDINASSLCSLGNILSLRIWWKWLSICVSVKIHDMHLASSFGTPHSKSRIITNCHKLVCSLDCTEAPDFVCVPQLRCIVTIYKCFGLTIFTSS